MRRLIICPKCGTGRLKVPRHKGDKGAIGRTEPTQFEEQCFKLVVELGALDKDNGVINERIYNTGKDQFGWKGKQEECTHSLSNLASMGWLDYIQRQCSSEDIREFSLKREKMEHWFVGNGKPPPKFAKSKCSKCEFSLTFVWE